MKANSLRVDRQSLHKGMYQGRLLFAWSWASQTQTVVQTDCQAVIMGETKEDQGQKTVSHVAHHVTNWLPRSLKASAKTPCLDTLKAVERARMRHAIFID
jgi:hypothetical protein